MKTSLAKEKVQIVLTEGISETAVKALAAAGYSSIKRLNHAPDEQELRELLPKTHILGIRSRTQITKEVLENAPKLIALGCFCIGTNQVDLDAAMQRGVPVFNAPFSNTRSVAELTISSIIALLRGVPEKNAALHRGEWRKSAKGSHEVRAKNLGIVGYGNIGSQLSVLASGLGMHVYYYDIEAKLPHGNARVVDSLDELYRISDIVTFHVPETDHTKLMVNAEAMNKMKEGVKIINYSRGSVVDIDALVTHLKTGHVGGAALDVYPIEPKSNDDPFVSPLTSFDNVLLTPHVGGSTFEAQENIGSEVAQKLITYSDNGSTRSAVNFPEALLPEHPGAHRIINIHKNVPGILSQINAVFSHRGANIVGQFLQTKGEVGYVVVDIDEEDNINIYKQELQAIQGSIRTRIIK